MKYFFINCFLSISPLVWAQSLLKPISIELSPTVVIQDSGDLSAMSNRISVVYRKALIDLAREYNLNFVELDTRHIDISVNVKLGLNDKYQNAYGKFFKYTTRTLFTAAKTDTTIAIVEIIYKDINGISDVELYDDCYDSFKQVFTKIAVPLERILEPVPPNFKENCLCLSINAAIVSNKNEKSLGMLLTHVLNNAIIFQQSDHRLQYFDGYKREQPNPPPKSCHEIRGLLKDTKTKYVLELQHDQQLNLKIPKPVKTKITFKKGLIVKGDYYEAIWQINKSIYDLIENNSVSK